jgi:beta-lactamase regulating signal transducer with metallopeptidase domain
MACTRQPARRQRLGELALLSSLAVAGLCLLPAWLPYSIPLWPADVATGVDAPEQCCACLDALNEASLPSPAPLQEEEMEALAAWLAIAQLTECEGEQDSPESPVLAAASGTNEPPQPPSDAGVAWRTWLSWLACLYLLAIGGLQFRWLTGYLGLRRLWRASQPAPENVAVLFARLTRHWRTPPRLGISVRLSLPISFGIWRPTILLPRSFCRPGKEAELRSVLVHELTHLERRDAWSCLLVALAQTVYFYLPWFWWLRRQVRLCQEYVADAAAAGLTSSEDYAEYLMTLSMLAPQRLPAGAGVTGVLKSPSDLFRRIAMLLNTSQRVERRCPHGWSLAAAGGFLAVAVLLSGISLQAQADDQTPKPTQAEPAKTVEKVIVVTPAGKVQEIERQVKALRAIEVNPQIVVRAVEALDVNPQIAVLGETVTLSVLDDGAEKAQLQQQIDKVIDELKKQGLPAEQLEQVRKQLEAARTQVEKARKQVEEATRRAAQQAEQAQRRARVTLEQLGKDGKLQELRSARLEGLTGAGRLGLQIQVPGEVLINQLDLPKGQGLVIVKVVPDSAAAKAGLQTHDILLQLAGEKVPSDMTWLPRKVGQLKADTPIDVIVLRKGQQVPVKGIVLPESPRQLRLRLDGQTTPKLEVVPRVGVRSSLRSTTPASKSVAITINRQNDQFTAQHREGDLQINLKGNIADGKATVSEISVRDGDKESKYESVEKVPEQYRDQVNSLIEMSTKGEVRVRSRSR